MRIKRLHLVNYRRHRDTEIELPDGLTTLVGRNGSGKSTLLEAIGFAFFGVPAARTAKDLLRWDRAAPDDEVRVTVEMELGGQAVRIVRSLRGKNLTPNATLDVDGHVQVAPGASSNGAATEAIERMLGMGRDAFFTTIVARQKELSRLADQRPADRKKLILGMLGVDALDRAIQAARGRANEARIRVETLQGAMPDEKALRGEQEDAVRVHREATARLDGSAEALRRAGQRLADARKQWDLVQDRLRERDRLQADLRAHKQRLEDAISRRKDLEKRVAETKAAAREAKRLGPTARSVDGRRRELERLRLAVKAGDENARLSATLADLEAERKALPSAEAPDGLVEQTEAELHALEQALTEAQKGLAVVENEGRNARERLHRVEGLDGEATCPMCEQPLVGHIDGLHMHLKTRAEQHETQAIAARSEVERLTRQRTESKALLDQLVRRREDARAAVRQRAGLDARIQDVRARRHALGDGAVPSPEDVSTAERLLAEAEDAAKQHVRAAALAESAPRLQTERDEASNGVERLQAQIKQLGEETHAATEAVGDVEAVQKAHQEAIVAERQATRDHAEAESAVRVAAAEEKACRRRVTEAAEARGRLQEATAEARRWQALAGGRGHGLLETFRSHLVARIGPAVSQEASRLLSRFTGGRYTEVLLDADYQLYVSDGGVHYTLDRFSGGEADLVHLALRLAVSRLLVERAGGADMRFLALDEVFGSLDTERRDLVLAALHGLGGLYSQVLLVTHQESLRDALDRAMVVEEVDGEARVRMHNG